MGLEVDPPKPPELEFVDPNEYEDATITGDGATEIDYRREELQTFLEEGAWEEALEEWLGDTDLGEREYLIARDLDLSRSSTSSGTTSRTASATTRRGSLRTGRPGSTTPDSTPGVPSRRSTPNSRSSVRSSRSSSKRSTSTGRPSTNRRRIFRISTDRSTERDHRDGVTRATAMFRTGPDRTDTNRASRPLRGSHTLGTRNTIASACTGRFGPWFVSTYFMQKRCATTV